MMLGYLKKSELAVVQPKRVKNVFWRDTLMKGLFFFSNHTQDVTLIQKLSVVMMDLHV